MTPPVQPESEIQKLEANIKAWFDEVMVKLHLMHGTAPAGVSTPVSVPVAQTPDGPPPAVVPTPTEALALGQTSIQNVGFYEGFKALTPEALSAWIVAFLTAAQTALASDTSGQAAIVHYEGVEYHVTDNAQTILIQLNNDSGTAFPTA